MKRAAGRPRGFTMIELLIILCVIGIIAVVLTPHLRRSLADGSGQAKELSDDQAKQKKTVADMRNVGTAMFSWLTDQVGAAAAGQSSTSVDLNDYPEIRQASLATILVPTYIENVPAKDGWGHDYESFLSVAEPLARNVMAIRSPGRDGLLEGDVYTVTSFEPNDFDHDLVWADGFFVRWPQRQ